MTKTPALEALEWIEEKIAIYEASNKACGGWRTKQMGREYGRLLVIRAALTQPQVESVTMAKRTWELIENAIGLETLNAILSGELTKIDSHLTQPEKRPLSYIAVDLAKGKDISMVSMLHSEYERQQAERTAMLGCIAELAGALKYYKEFHDTSTFPNVEAKVVEAIDRAEQFLKEE